MYDKEGIIHGKDGTVFCCWGCETVYSIIHREDFSLINPPRTDSSEFEYLDKESFLQDYVFDVNGKPGMRFFIEGIQCTSCLWIIEQIPNWIPQVENVHLNMSQNTLLVSLKEDGYFGKVASAISALGYRVHPIKNLDEARILQKKENHRQLKRLGIAAACAGNIMLVSFSLYSGVQGQMARLFTYLNLVFFLPVLFYCALPFYQNLWRALKTRRPSIDLPIVAAVVIGFVLSLFHAIRGSQEFYFDSLSVLVFLLLASRYILQRTQQTFISSSYLQSFIKSQVCRRWNTAGQAYEEVPARLLCVGDMVFVKKGERIPADGILASAWVNINPSILTGESLPQKIFKDSRVFAGTQVVSDSAEIVIEKSTDDSRIGEILRKVEEQVHNKTPLTSLTDKAAQYFSIFILALGALFFAIYILFDPEDAVQRTLALIILACPCALAFATPLTHSISLRKAARKGYLVKNSEALEKLSRVQNAFFDKTGTLTQGLFEFLRWESPTMKGSSDFQPDIETLYAIYSIELHSHHPVARTLVKHLEKSHVKKLPVHSYREISGSGVSGMVNGVHYKITSAPMKTENKDDADIITSFISIQRNDEVVAYACLGDRLHHDTKHTISKLKKMGVMPFVLSGDAKSPVFRVANKLCLEESHVYPCLLPEEKNKIVKKHPNSLMVGDGVNDSLAMSSSAIGIAVQGSVESSLVAADVYLTRGGIAPVIELILLSKNTFTVIKRNLVFSFVYNFTGGVAALFGYISPLVAAILMPVSSFVVLTLSISGTRFLRRFNKENSKTS